MVRNAATCGATPVPSRWRAARTGGRIGVAGWSAMGKAAGLGVIPRYATAFNAFEWNQRRTLLPELVIRAVVRARVRGIGRAATLVLIPGVALLAIRGRFVLWRRGSREAAGLICQKKKCESQRSRVSSSWKNVPSDQYQFSVYDEGQLFPDLSEKYNVNMVALSTHQQPLTEGWGRSWVYSWRHNSSGCHTKIRWTCTQSC